MKSQLPKVLHRVGDKVMVEHVIRAARAAGIKDIIAVVGHGSDKVTRVLKRMDVTTVTQDVQRGTGHAVLQAYPLLAAYTGDLVVLSGDTPLIRSETIKHLIDAHTRHSNVITFATAVVPDARGYGRIVRDSNGNFAAIVEEKDADPRIKRIREINAGMYCMRTRPLFDALLSVKADNRQREYYLPAAIATMKSRGGRVEAVVIDDYTEMLGVNTAGDLAAVRKLYSGRRTDADNKRRLENGIHRKRR
jgi:bifunctional UDP-N-acetylglucosamine pyrophosphorylase/glucosamine-1-phosphate N-acetyltransferase